MIKFCTIDYDEHATQNLYKSVVREHLVKYVKYKACLFYFNLYLFFSGLSYWSDTLADFDTQLLKLRRFMQGSAFGGPHYGRPQSGGQLPKHPKRHFQAISLKN